MINSNLSHNHQELLQVDHAVPINVISVDKNNDYEQRDHIAHGLLGMDPLRLLTAQLVTHALQNLRNLFYLCCSYIKIKTSAWHLAQLTACDVPISVQIKRAK